MCSSLDGRQSRAITSTSDIMLQRICSSPRGIVFWRKLIQTETADQTATPAMVPPNSRQFSTRTFETSMSTYRGGVESSSNSDGCLLLLEFVSAACRTPRPIGFVQAAEISHDALPRPAFGADRFDQRPVSMPLAIDRAKVGDEENMRVLYGGKKPSSRTKSFHYNASPRLPHPRPPTTKQRLTSKFEPKKLSKLSKLGNN